jgi:hypothetical protein
VRHLAGSAPPPGRRLLRRTKTEAGYVVKRSFVVLADVTGAQVANCPLR